jgi:hypothetical protein
MNAPGPCSCKGRGESCSHHTALQDCSSATTPPTPEQPITNHAYGVCERCPVIMRRKSGKYEIEVLVCKTPKGYQARGLIEWTENEHAEFYGRQSRGFSTFSEFPSIEEALAEGFEEGNQELDKIKSSQV